MRQLVDGELRLQGHKLQQLILLSSLLSLCYTYDITIVLSSIVTVLCGDRAEREERAKNSSVQSIALPYPRLYHLSSISSGTLLHIVHASTQTDEVGVELL